MLGESLALLAALTWSISVILFKRSESIPPQGLNLFKNVAAIVLLLLSLPLLGQGIDWQRPAADWWRLVVSGAVGIAIADTVVFMALRKLGPGRLAVVDCAYAPTIVVLSVLFLGERFGPGFFLGAVLVVGGVLLATVDWKQSPAARMPLLKALAAGGAQPIDPEQCPSARSPQLEPARRRRGVALALFGMICMAIGIVVAKPALVRGMLVEVTLIRLIAGVAGQLLWMIAVPSQRKALQVFRPSAVWRTLIPASILGSYVSMLLWLGGFKWAEASVATVLNQMATVFTIVLARIFLGEQLTKRRAIGSAAAVAGVLMVLLWPDCGALSGEQARSGVIDPAHRASSRPILARDAPIVEAGSVGPAARSQPLGRAAPRTGLSERSGL